jgi:UDP-N-acetylmuramoyl-L-alanyl-D-glutamate--2,6-diaminopimelate ligase
VSNLTNTAYFVLARYCWEFLPVRGRMTPIICGQNFEVLVDYAHTPSSFEAVFPGIAKRAKEKRGRLISVFGSAGERDTLKRGRQGRIAGSHSNIIILTDEDPRGEDSFFILWDIAEGVAQNRERTHVKDETLFFVPDRKAAIRKAFAEAREDDIVLLLGKGHENNIIYKDHEIPFDEITEAKKALAEMGYSSCTSESE